MRRLTAFLLPLALLATSLAPFAVPQALAGGANMYVSAPSSVTVGQTISVDIMVNTNGQAANSFDAVLSFSSGLLTPVRGATGAVCNLYVSQPDPTSNPDEVECGKSNGFTGAGSIGTFIFTAAAAGTVSFGLSSCQVLANDGLGTDITGGCSGTSMGVAAAAVATPTPTAVATAKATVKPTAVTNQTPKAAETPHTPTPTVAPTPPPVVALPSTSSTPTPAAASNATAAATNSTSTSTGKQRTIGQAVGDLFSSLKEIGSLPKDITGVLALLLALLPTMAILVAILFLVYRLFGLERRRRRTMDRLFELELSELSALEGKMDLLTEKGVKGKEQYKDEFEKAKANILREIRPDFGKPVDPPASTTPPPTA